MMSQKSLAQERKHTMSFDEEKPRQETYLFDVESGPEIARLIAQGDGATRAMGWLLPPGIELEPHATVLDLACGPGGWVLDIAFGYPEVEVAGIDVSRTLVDYANARARSQHLTNASFGVMDILEPLDFSNNSFDLVNLRFGVSVVPVRQWPAVLADVLRILRPGGWAVFTEGELGDTTSPAANTLSALVSQALKANGQSFDPHGQRIGVTTTLESLIRTAGFHDIGRQPHMVNFSIWSQDYLSWCMDLRVIFATIQPVIEQMGLATRQDYDRLRLAFEIEMNQEWFSGVGFFLSVWGRKPTIASRTPGALP
jgi:ubiquinone/menaquinone biosynthesis C-methylase UbiE